MNHSREVKALIVFAAIIAYALLFNHYDNLQKNRVRQLSPVMPEIIYKSALGFLEQIGAESLFIKTKVFFGGLEPSAPIDNPRTYADYYKVIVSLHPEFMDTYHFSESILPWTGEELTRLNNQILIRGVETHPDYFMLYFYLGFNHFYFLKNYKKAATYFWQASEKKDAPSWLGHLAATLSAQGGDIIGGLLLLRAMEHSETSEQIKKRYQSEIVEYKKAVTVQQAMNAFVSRNQRFPATLDELTPEFLPALPVFSDEFKLIYAPPELRMVRNSEQ